MSTSKLGSRATTFGKTYLIYPMAFSQGDNTTKESGLFARKRNVRITLWFQPSALVQRCIQEAKKVHTKWHCSVGLAVLVLKKGRAERYRGRGPKYDMYKGLLTDFVAFNTHQARAYARWAPEQCYYNLEMHIFPVASAANPFRHRQKCSLPE